MMSSNNSGGVTPVSEGRTVGNRKVTKRRHTCCCNLLHITTATLFIGSSELCYFAYEVFSTVHHFMQTGEQYVLSLSISLFGFILALIAVLLLFAAVVTSTPYLLVPHLLMQAAAVFVLSLMCLFCIITLMTGTSLDFRIVNVEDSPAGDLALGMAGDYAYELTHISRALALFLSSICIILITFAFLQVWMLIIVLQCFFYIQEKVVLKAQPPTMDTEVDMLPADEGRDSNINDSTDSNCFSTDMNQTNSFMRAETDC